MASLHHPGFAPPDFIPPRRPQRKQRDRLAAGLLTLALYGAFGALLVFGIVNGPPPAIHQREEEVSLVPSPPQPPLQLNFTTHFLKEKVQEAAAPQFTILNPNTDVKSQVPVAPTSGTSPVATAAPAQGGAGETSACIDPEYLASITAHLVPYFIYPPRAVAHAIHGEVLIHFTSDRSGHVLLAEVAKSSGFPVLDDAALSLIRRAQPFPPMPARMHADTLNGLLPIAFSIGRTGTTTGKASGPGCS